MIDWVEGKSKLNYEKKGYEQLFVFMWPLTATLTIVIWPLMR